MDICFFLSSGFRSREHTCRCRDVPFKRNSPVSTSTKGTSPAASVRSARRRRVDPLSCCLCRSSQRSSATWPEQDEMTRLIDNFRSIRACVYPADLTRPPRGAKPSVSNRFAARPPVCYGGYETVRNLYIILVYCCTRNVLTKHATNTPSL